jgi:hypothetical protein
LPAPIAFRAGNYGANDDTLRALVALGLGYDSSHVPALVAADSDCAIALTRTHRQPTLHCGLVEVPVGCIGMPGGGLRHAQITALSRRELCAAINHAQICGHESFTLVSHSFELVSRDRLRINQLIARRFERFCAAIAAMEGVTTATYVDQPPVPQFNEGSLPVLSYHPGRGAHRVIEQALANVLYSRRLRPGS